MAFQLSVELCRSALDLESTRHDALGAAPSCNARFHYLPQRQQTSPNLCLGSPRLLISQHERTDRQPVLATLREEFSCGRKGIGHRCRIVDDRITIIGGLIDHKTTAYRVINATVNHLPRFIQCRKAHAIAVKG